MGTDVAPVRVCHVIHDLGPGGAEQVLVELAAVASSAGLAMSVLSLMPADSEHRTRELRRLGVPVRSLGLPGRWDPRALGGAVPVLRAARPDVVHTHLKHADLVGGLAAARLGVPQVSTLHLVEDAVRGVASRKRWLAAIARQRLAARTIAVSDAVRDWYVDDFGADPARVVTIRNGVVAPPMLSAARRALLRSELGAAPTTVLAVMVGIMRPGKGHADLVAAAAMVPADLDLRVVLVGDGELRGEVETLLTRTAAPAGRFHLAGFRDDVPAVVAAADLVVQPSRFDALPTALISAAAAGRPVVATTAGGIPEIVSPATGLLVQPGDVHGLASALTALAGDEHRRAEMGAAAKERFAAEFDARRWAARLRALYDDVLAERAQRCA